MVKVKNKKGFTLIELSMVIAIIGILYSVSIPLFSETAIKAKETALKDNLHIMRKAIDNYYSVKEHYPETIQKLVDDKFIRFIPVDSITKQKDWKIVNHEKGGIYDIHSNSNGTSLNGTIYSSW